MAEGSVDSIPTMDEGTETTADDIHELADQQNSSDKDILGQESNISSQLDKDADSSTLTDTIEQETKPDEHSDTVDGSRRSSSRPCSQILPPSELEEAVTQLDTDRVAAILQESSTDVMMRNLDGHNVLHELVLRYLDSRSHSTDQFVAVLSLLVKHGLDVNAPVVRAGGAHLKELKYSSLHLAASQHDGQRVIKALVSCGGKVNVEDGHGQTPLHLATAQQLTGNMETLLEAGADPNRIDEYGQTALHIAIKGRHKPLDIVRLLLRSDCKPNIQDATGKTALHLSAKYSNIKGVKELIQAGSDVNVKDTSGQTPMHYACAHDSSGDIVKELLSANAEINVQETIKSETPAHKAARYRMMHNVMLLCSTGQCDVNIPDQSGNTLLHIAASLSDWKLWAELLRQDGDVTLLNAIGYDPLHLMKRYKNKLSYLVERYGLEEQEW